MIIWEHIDEDGTVHVEFGKSHARGEIYIREEVYPQRTAAMPVSKQDIRELRDALTAWLEDQDKGNEA